ncbi:MAG: sugar ABC transporter ATP-binding protein [Alphaproteobacteria bacterium]|nr:sugar ABC transporter ATP-binding protein [Alphaproteobacteria bacterium]
MSRLLKMSSISKGFPGVQALSGVDFTLDRGEVHALVGKNGAGKSTLIKILGGVFPPDGGDMKIEGKAVDLSSPHAAMEKGVAIVHQELSLVPQLTVAENIFLGRLGQGSGWWLRWTDLAAKAQTVLKRLDSAIDPKATVRDLSVAQQQLVEIAKALARDPHILVLDEPTSALADQDAERLLHILRRLASDGVGIVYISHRLAEVEQVADRVTVLRDGNTVSSVAMAEVDRRRIVELMLGEELSHGDDLHPPKNRGDVVLSVQGLSRSGVVEDVSFDLHKGEILGIAGLVGAGRTELVRLIFGCDQADAGEISIGGQRIERLSPRRMCGLGVGYLPEDRKSQGLVLDLSIRENMVMTVLHRMSDFGFMNRRRERDVVDQLIADLQVACSDTEMPARTLSGGNQQKIVIGKWLATKPALLILDEPTRGIDVQAKAQIFRILEGLAETGVAIIFISSEIEEVMMVSHRILTMANGRIVGETEGANADLADILLCATGT